MQRMVQSAIHYERNFGAITMIRLKQLITESEQHRISETAKSKFLEIVSKYRSFGNKMKRQHSISEISKALSVIAGAAERVTLSESDDWFDDITVKRNMKELKTLSDQFEKNAVDAAKIEQRMEALYEDMGHVLNRYFEISENKMSLSESKSSSDYLWSSLNNVIYDLSKVVDRLDGLSIPALDAELRNLIGPIQTFIKKTRSFK